MNDHKLTKTSLIYLLFSAAAQFLNMLLIPIYTRNLTVDQFGQYSLINSIQCLLSIFVTLGVFSGLRRFYHEYEDKNKLKNIALTFSLVWGCICIFFGILSSPLTGPVFFKGDACCSKYIQYIVINSSLLCLISIYTSYYAMQFKAVRIGIIEALKIVLTIAATFYFLYALNNGVLGILRSQTAAYAVIALFLIITDIKNIKPGILRNELRCMLAYGIGLVPGQVSAWVLNLIDRYFIKFMMSLSSVGIYSMAYKIGMLVNPMFITPFNNAFTPVKYSIYNNEDGKKKLRETFRYYNFIGCFFILVLSLFSSVIIKLLSTPEYEEGYKIVPLIAFSYFIYGMENFYALGLHLANKTYIASMVTGIAAVVNVIFNFALIPAVGIFGAATATIISYTVANIIYFYTGKKYYDLHIGILEPYKYVVVFAALYMVYFISKIYFNSIFVEMLVCMVLCMAYPVICIKTGLVSYSRIKSFLKGFAGRIRVRLAPSAEAENLKGAKA